MTGRLRGHHTGGPVTYVMAFNREYVESWQEFVVKPKHTGKKKHKCDEPGCGYVTAKKSDLTRHMFTHTGEKMHKCTHPGCGYATANKSHLTAHMRTHTGEKKHKCDEPGCGYATAKKSDLTAHMCTHKMKKGK